MRISVRHHDRISVIDVSGTMSIPKEVPLREACLGLLKEGRGLILMNLKQVPWIDSAGIGELVNCQNQVREQGGVIKLLNPTNKVKDAIGKVGLAKTRFEIFTDERDALASFSAHPSQPGD